MLARERRKKSCAAVVFLSFPFYATTQLRVTLMAATSALRRRTVVFLLAHQSVKKEGALYSSSQCLIWTNLKFFNPTPMAIRFEHTLSLKVSNNTSSTHCGDFVSTESFNRLGNCCCRMYACDLATSAQRI